MNDTLTGWHFLKPDRRLQFKPHTPVTVGQTLTLPEGTAPKLCAVGYHASVRVLDALDYAPRVSGLVCCRVTLTGTILRDSDKAVATHRTCHAMLDADAILREFACWCAEGALLGQALRGRPVDPRSWDAITVTRAWMRGEATDAVRDAARDAVRDAAGDAVRAAARAAAWAANWAANWDLMNTELERRMLAAMGVTP
jgi:hypothetical protein